MEKQEAANGEDNRERSRGEKQVNRGGGVNGIERNGRPILGNKVFRTPEQLLAWIVDPLTVSFETCLISCGAPLPPMLLPHRPYVPETYQSSHVRASVPADPYA